LQRTKRILFRGDVKDTASSPCLTMVFSRNSARTLSAHSGWVATPTRCRRREAGTARRL